MRRPKKYRIEISPDKLDDIESQPLAFLAIGAFWAAFETKID